MSRSECLLFGALGGMCPTIANLASSFSAQPEQPLPKIGALIALGLFAFLGSIIAMGFGAREVKAAIVAGIAAPGIVTNIVSGAQSAANTTTFAPVVTGYLIGVSPAFAQSEDIGTGRLVDPALYGGNRAIQIVPAFEGGTPDAVNLPVIADVAIDGTTTQVQVGTIFSPAPQTIILPEGVTGLTVGDEMVLLTPADQSVSVQIDTAPTLTGDLLWALGGKRTYQIEQIQLTPQQ